MLRIPCLLSNIFLWLCLALRFTQNTLDGMQVLEGSRLPRAGVRGCAFSRAWGSLGSLGPLNLPLLLKLAARASSGCRGWGRAPGGRGRKEPQAGAPWRGALPAGHRDTSSVLTSVEQAQRTWSPVSCCGRKGQAGRTAWNPDDRRGGGGVGSGGPDSALGPARCPARSWLVGHRDSTLAPERSTAVFVSAVCAAGPPPAGEGSSLPSHGQAAALTTPAKRGKWRCPSEQGFECFPKL